MKHLTVTTEELAKICGVSQGTVDRALNDRPDIKAETKQKILETAALYGYRQCVPTVSEGIKGLIGVIIFNLNNEYFSKLVTEAEYALREQGFGTVVMMSHYDKRYETECIRNLYNMGVKGIILCSVNRGAEFENYLKLFNIPIVSVGNRIDSLPYVGVDDFKAMRDTVNTVLSEPFDNIIYFSPALEYPDAYAQIKRYEGFLNAVGDRNYTVVKDIDGIRKRYDGKTVIFCSTDYYALKVYFKAENVKTVGFDKIDLIEKCKLPITSLGYSMPEIASAAVRAIIHNSKENVFVKHFISEP